MNVLIAGDIHNEFGRLNALMNRFRKKADLVILPGDFGYWPRMSRKIGYLKVGEIVNHGIPILWCDGNHEDHQSLGERDSDELVPGITYMPRGSTYTLEDGRTIMFMGGAFSTDYEERVVGYNWFPREEMISQKDMMNLPDVKVDIFITHTCPTELYTTMVKYYDGRNPEPSNFYLSELWKRYRPDLWFFGHWHHYKTGNLELTRWYALNHSTSGSRWWMWLPQK